MKENPEQKWFDLRQAAMDRLKGENEALMKRLGELEKSGTEGNHIDDETNAELVPRESWELVNREKQELEDTIKQKEKRLLRLQQVCTKTVRISRLTGIIQGIPIQKCGVSRNHRVYPRSQTGLLPKRTSARYFHV